MNQEIRLGHFEDGHSFTEHFGHGNRLFYTNDGRRVYVVGGFPINLYYCNYFRPSEYVNHGFIARDGTAFPLAIVSRDTGRLVRAKNKVDQDVIGAGRVFCIHGFFLRCGNTHFNAKKLYFSICCQG